MGLVVQKYGGTSVGDAERIRAVADHVARTVAEGNQVVVVVSAMGKTTDDLIRLADQVSTEDRKSTRLNSSHSQQSRMPSSA